MLGQQAMPSYLQGENAMANAVNQQERIVRIARLAGIWDCEGCFYLNRRALKGAHGQTREFYAIVAKMSNSDHRLTDEVCETLSMLGFKYNRTNNLPTGMGGLISEVRMHGMKRARGFIELMAPYLSAKSQIVDLAKKFCERRSSVAYNAPHNEEDFRIYRAMRAVNSHGTARDIPVGDHLELVGSSRIAKLNDVQMKAKLAAIVECDGSLGLTKLRDGKNLMPAVYICNTNPELLSEIRVTLAALGLPYYFQMRPPRGISVKPQGEFHIQGMKRAYRFMQATVGYFVAYAKRAKLITDFIEHRMKLPANFPYSEYEFAIKKAVDADNLPDDYPQRPHAEQAHRLKVESGPNGDIRSAAEMTAPINRL